MAKRINCLVPSERAKECTEHAFSYSGRMPCTGVLKCLYCNTRKEEGAKHGQA
jgi:hypothetical protein